MKGVTASSRGQGTDEKATHERISARCYELQSRFISLPGLFLGTEQLVFLDRLQAKISTAHVALNTAHIARSLGQKHWLDFITEEFKNWVVPEPVN